MLGYLGKVGRMFTAGGGAGHPSLDLSFMGTTLDNRMTFSRGGTATDGLYTDAAGSGYNTYASGAPRLVPNKGLLFENATTNRLLNTDAPVTQTTASLTTGTWCLWVIGTGSATVSAGTATITGAGTATAGSPNTFNVTVAGTVTVTVSGSLTRFQLEVNFPTSYVPSTGTVGGRSNETLTIPLGGWFNTNVGTLWSEATLIIGLANNPKIFSIDDGTNSNRYTLMLGVAGHVTMEMNTGGVFTDQATASAITLGTTFRCAGTYNANGIVAALIGSVSGKAALSSGQPPGLNTLRVGYLSSGINYANGFIRRIRYYPREMQAAELASVTT